MRKSSVRPARGLTPALAAWAILPVAAAAVLGASLPQPALLWNRSPSEPLGLYVRTPGHPARGAIIAFQAPAPAFPYADGQMDYLRRIPILKAIAAGEGDHVCTDGGTLTINGIRRAPVLSHDSRGVGLPRWAGCRAMARGEFFVFSDRIPNSFDSRYFGPVTTREILGVFRPLSPSIHSSGDR